MRCVLRIQSNLGEDGFEPAAADGGLRKATLTLGCEIAAHGSFMWTQDEVGCGGLPVGSAGKTLLLLSGGIDSPVAGHLAQRRGCELESVYFHSPPFVPQDTLDKVKELGSVLASAQSHMLLHNVYFTSIQKAIKPTVNQSIRCCCIAAYVPNRPSRGKAKVPSVGNWREFGR